MSERLERLQREIASERALLLAELGLAFDGPLLVVGRETADQAIQKRLRHVPEMLRQDAESRLRRSVVALPWLGSRWAAQGATQ